MARLSVSTSVVRNAYNSTSDGARRIKASLHLGEKMYSKLVYTEKGQEVRFWTFLPYICMTLKLT